VLSSSSDEAEEATEREGGLGISKDIALRLELIAQYGIWSNAAIKPSLKRPDAQQTSCFEVADPHIERAWAPLGDGVRLARNAHMGCGALWRTVLLIGHWNDRETDG